MKRCARKLKAAAMELLEIFQPYSEQVRIFFEKATGTWILYQTLAVCLAFACSYLLTRTISRKIARFIASREGHWLSEWKREILERVAPIIFLIAIWAAVLIFRQITWPSNSFLLNIVAKLTTAWIVINVLASVVRNRFLFRVVSVSLWIVAALSILRMLPGITRWLDENSLSVGGATISYMVVIKAIGLLILLFWGVGFASRLAEKGLNRSSDISPSMKVLLAKLIRIVLVVAAIVVAMRTVGIDLTAFAIFSGAVGVGVGFGLQTTVSNFISGISLLLDKSIKPGDVISVGDSFGWITALNTRYTSVVTRDGREHLIPNENLITQQVVNWSYSDSKVRLEVPIGVSYKADPHLVKTLLEKAAGKNSRILAIPAPVAQFTEFGDSSLNFLFRFWINDPAQGLANIKSDVLFAIWDALKENNIEIPYPTQDLYAPKGIKIHLERGAPSSVESE